MSFVIWHPPVPHTDPTATPKYSVAAEVRMQFDAHLLLISVACIIKSLTHPIDSSAAGTVEVSPQLRVDQSSFNTTQHHGLLGLGL